MKSRPTSAQWLTSMKSWTSTSGADCTLSFGGVFTRREEHEQWGEEELSHNNDIKFIMVEHVNSHRVRSCSICINLFFEVSSGSSRSLLGLFRQKSEKTVCSEYVGNPWWGCSLCENWLIRTFIGWHALLSQHCWFSAGGFLLWRPNWWCKFF